MFFILIFLLMGQFSFYSFLAVAGMALVPPLWKWITPVLVFAATATWIFPFVYFPTLFFVRWIPLTPPQAGLLHLVSSACLSIWIARKNRDGLQALASFVIGPARQLSRSLISFCVQVLKALWEVSVKVWRIDVAPFVARHSAAIILALAGAAVIGLFGQMVLQTHLADLVTPDSAYREAIQAYAAGPKVYPWPSIPTPHAPSPPFGIRYYRMSLIANAVILLLNWIGLRVQRRASELDRKG